MITLQKGETLGKSQITIIIGIVNSQSEISGTFIIMIYCAAASNGFIEHCLITAVQGSCTLT